MDLEAIAALILAVVSVVGMMGTGYKWAREQGKKDALAEQAHRTVEALTTQNEELQEQNDRLWSVVDQLGGQQEEP